MPRPVIPHWTFVLAALCSGTDSRGSLPPPALSPSIGVSAGCPSFPIATMTLIDPREGTDDRAVQGIQGGEDGFRHYA
jgi:hypothetical protein